MYGIAFSADVHTILSSAFPSMFFGHRQIEMSEIYQPPESVYDFLLLCYLFLCVYYVLCHLCSIIADSICQYLIEYADHLTRHCYN